MLEWYLKRRTQKKPAAFWKQEEKPRPEPPRITVAFTCALGHHWTREWVGRQPLRSEREDELCPECGGHSAPQ